MKGIVTLRNEDKTYDGVGMNNKTITSDLKTTQGIRNRAFAFAISRKRDAVKIEFYPSERLYAMPSSVEEWEQVGASWRRKQKLVRK
jgi:hypothetical protein